MSDRIEITLNAVLPEKGKHGILADAETQADALAVTLSAAHGITFTATTKAVRPGKKTAIAQAITLAPEPLAASLGDGLPPTVMQSDAEVERITGQRPRRHAAE